MAATFNEAEASVRRAAQALADVAQGKKAAASRTIGTDHWLENLRRAEGSSDWSLRTTPTVERPWFDMGS